MERLQKFLARTGIASRRHSEEIIAQGRVRVNGKTVTVQGLKIDPFKDRIEVDGKPVGRPEKKIYIVLNKPPGYVTTVQDPRGRRKVTDLLKNVRQRVYPVGRLDYDTEGLLLLTNDGDLAYAMTHPSHEIPKTYRARVRGVPEDSKLKALARGVVLDDGPTAPARVRLLGVKGEDGLIEITIHEGRNRQVRRMCEHIGHPVISLRRVSIGPLTIGGLKPGEYRTLGFKEVSRLKKLAKVSDYKE
ncbi:pseudouridine synthase [Desulfotruncus alcoholivorax]|uniref:pseudouridine synthase n=1 Tax=Desulfotruncus alcoholivorax TaxID=265477 RepID=UPI00047FC327|nr:pseudouridine synthase [Desulfotruncus alcoholivorax]